MGGSQISFTVLTVKNTAVHGVPRYFVL